jgi:polyisoprenoid-binding protein YceI
MNRLLLFICLSVFSISGMAQTYKPVKEGTTVKFKIRNLGFNTTGSFSGIGGTITFDPANLATCSFDVSVDAQTVNTGIDARDNHLRKEEYFDVKNHPHIKFVSSRVTKSTRAGTLFVYGRLTIKGVTKDISFPFTAKPIDGGYLFNGEFKLNRRDFKVGGGSTVSDNLTVMLDVTAKKN